MPKGEKKIHKNKSREKPRKQRKINTAPERKIEQQKNQQIGPNGPDKNHQWKLKKVHQLLTIENRNKAEQWEKNLKNHGSKCSRNRNTKTLTKKT